MTRLCRSMVQSGLVCSLFSIALAGVSVLEGTTSVDTTLLPIAHSNTALRGGAGFTKIMLENAMAEGAVCLDGTPGGYFFQPATDAVNANNWILYFEGGGWCYSVEDCWGRSFGDLGSSARWPATMGSQGGLISDNCDVNPDFCKYNKVYMKYCDGNSFSGTRAGPVVHQGRNIFFRGRNILNSIMKDIAAKYNFGSAGNVLLTGCSAGGLATFLHADYVKSLLPKSVVKYGAAPISGFFMDYPSVDATAGNVYGAQMKVTFELTQAATGMNDKCIADKSDEEKWQCNMAPYVIPYIQSPLFVLNSKYDSWQTICVLTAEPVPAGSTDNGHCAMAPGWSNCSKDEEQCTADQIDVYNQFGDAVDHAMTAGLKKGKDGAFLVSCHTHCECQSDVGFAKYTINGISAAAAMGKWWSAIGNNVSVDIPVVRDCSYNPQGPVKKCNLACQG